MEEKDVFLVMHRCFSKFFNQNIEVGSNMTQSHSKIKQPSQIAVEEKALDKNKQTQHAAASNGEKSITSSCEKQLVD